MSTAQLYPTSDPIHSSRNAPLGGIVGAPRSTCPNPGDVAFNAWNDETEESLEQLLEQARGGDQVALGLLYKRFSPAIFRYLRHHAADAELAADLTADVFVRVLEAIRNGHTWHRSFTGWIYRIARNVLVDHVRRVGRRPQTELADREPRADVLGMDEEVERRQVAREVQAAIDELRPSYAQLLRLRFADDLTQADIGRKMGKSEVTVKVTQHRALRALRECLDGRPAVQAYVS